MNKLVKLRAMPPREIRTRLTYSAFCAAERLTLGRSPLPDPTAIRSRLRPDLRQSPDWKQQLLTRRPHAVLRFFPSAANPGPIRDAFSGAYYSNRTAALATADDVLRQKIAFFGRTFEFLSAIPWNADPVSGTEWPRVYHRDVPTHAPARFGDVKYVWELNRHQFFVDLAKGWFLTRDRRYVTKLLELLGSWIADNPYGIGVSWACALEPAFRAVSWLWSYHLCADAPLADEPHLAWLASFDDHGRFLYRHLEHYISPYNHLVGEAAALYMLGVLFPEFDEAGRWRRRGRQVLESEVARQFYEDGGSVEQSPFYHHATLGFYLLAASLGRLNGEEFSPAVWRRIEQAIEFSMHLQQPDGTTPRIGGADDGKPLRMEHRPLWDFRFVQAIGAVLFRRGDFKTAAGSFAEDALWLLGEDGRTAFDAITPLRPPSSVSLPASGYYVMRSGAGAEADYVCFDCGEQADGLRRDDVPSAAHGHADCLATIVWLKGRPVLVDAGVFAYNGPADWVGHFRRTGAHNTLRVDGQDQAEYRGRMDWARTYAPLVEHCDLSEGQWRVTGSHDGFRRLDDRLVHRRTVYLRSGYVVICDEVTCSRPHDVELVFQFAPGEAVFEGGDRLVFDGGVEMAWSSPLELHTTLARGGTRPSEGWVAESLGVRVPAPRLSLLAAIDRPGAVFLTVVADLAITGGERRLHRVGGAIDVVMAPGMASRGARERVAALDIASRDAAEPVSITAVDDHLAFSKA